MNARPSSLSASKLSVILIIMLCGLLVILIGGGAFIGSRLVSRASTATHARIDAEVSAGGQARYEALKKYLADNAQGVSQTAALTKGLGTYTQSSVVSTLNGYASQAGVTITNFDLGTATGPAAAASTAGPITVNLTLNSPVRYANFIVFLRLVEQGLMPAQITSGDVTQSTESGTVAVSQLTVKVVQ